jgi:hypothetical protein
MLKMPDFMPVKCFYIQELGSNLMDQIFTICSFKTKFCPDIKFR